MELRKVETTTITQTAAQLVRDIGGAALSEPMKGNLLAQAVACLALSEAPDPDLKVMRHLASRIAKSNPWFASARQLAKLISAKQ